MSSSLQDLLAEARWLEGLAQEIVGDPTRARDLVQDVWVASLERAPAHVRQPRTWLATVLRNAVRREHRSTSARRVRELAIAKHETSTAPDVVLRAEGQRLLVESVLALEEPWRSTVLWHYFDGSSCADIARREGLSASTVRNRLARALELLRERLERSGIRASGLAGIAWLVPEWRALVVRSASVKAASIGGMVTGGVLMSVVVKAVAAVVASACLAWWLWPATKPSGPGALEQPLANSVGESTIEGTAAEPTRKELRGSSAPSVAAAPESNPPGPSAAAVHEEPLPAGVIEGIVLENGVACTRGGRVEWLPGWMEEYPDDPDVTQLRATDLRADGTFHLEGVEDRDSSVRALVRGGIIVYGLVYAGRAQRMLAPGRRVVMSFGSARLTGHVWDEEGRPRVGARVRLDFQATKPQELNTLFTARTDVDGAYVFDHLSAGRGMGMLTFESSSGGDLREHFAVTIESGGQYTHDFGAPHPWPTWTSTLRTRAGASIGASAHVILRDPAGRDSYRSIATDATGRLSARVPPGAYGVWIELGGREDELAAGVLEVRDLDVEHDLVVPGTRFTGRVKLADGAVPTGMTNGLLISLRPVDRKDPSSVRSANVAADGRFAVDALEPGTYIVSAYPRPLAGVRDSVQVIVRADDFEITLDLVLAAR